MNIPVDDQHPEKCKVVGFIDGCDCCTVYVAHSKDLLPFLPFKVIFLLCVSSCYGHVVEHTETVGSAAHTVVSWRSVNTGKQVRQVIIQSGYKIKPQTTSKKTSARGCGVMNVDHSQVFWDCV